MIFRHLIFTIVFVKIVSISCDKQYGSLTFVIDDTYSMRDEMEIVKEATDSIMDVVLNSNSTQIKDLVLVTFNDPEHLTTLRVPRTTNKYAIKNALKLHATSSGGDCNEYSLSGIKKGIQESRDNSYIFVFTDAPPKDGCEGYCKPELQSRKLNEVVDRARKTGSQIFFFLTPGCIDWNKENSMPYYKISTATNGQVFKVENKKDVKQLMVHLKELIGGEENLITRQVIPAGKLEIIPFTVDDETEHVHISVSSYRGIVQCDIIEGPTRTYDKIVWNNNNKILIIHNPDVGNYKVSVQGSDSTTITIVRRTNFTFGHAFSEALPATFRNDRKVPTEGKNYHLLIKVNDPTASVDVKHVEITSIDQKTDYLPRLPLRPTGENNVYATELFTPPNNVFIITVVGEGKLNKRNFTRTSKTPIQPRPRETAPTISIYGGGKYEYDSRIVLKCTVKANPKPKIIWKDEEGNIKKQIVNGESIEIEIENLKHRLVYYCYAENDVAENSEQVVLDVISPFVVDDPEHDALVNVNFDETTYLHCNIKLRVPHLRMRITWYQVFEKEKKILGNSRDYTISNDGNELKINKVQKGNEGKYICLAVLEKDKDTERALEREVRIKHVVPIMEAPKKIKVKENENINLKCDVIKAFPKPEITWEFKEADNYKRLSYKGEQITIPKASLNSAGVYKCTAKNDKGSSEQETNVIVQSEPKITIRANEIEDAKISLEYGTNLLLACHVISHTPPTVSWKKGNQTLRSDTEKRSRFEYISKLSVSELRKNEIYHCEASNELTTTSKSVDVRVNSPFIVKPSNIIKSEYDAEATLECGVTSLRPLKIIKTWYRNGQKLENSDKFSISSDGSSLKIKKVTLDFQGKYTCDATITDDKEANATHDSTLQITGLEVPQIQAQPPQIIFRDQTAKLKCNTLKGHPKPNITWSFKQDKYDKFTALSAVENTLPISFAQYKDTGKYKCVATNVMGIAAQTFELVVQGPPEILSTETLHTAIIGDPTLRIPCLAIGYPVPVITWETGANASTIGNSLKYLVESDGTLLIKNPDDNDAQKEFTCHAKNKFGSANQTFQVDVTELNENWGNITYIDILEGNTTELHCQNGTLEGRWFKIGQPMENQGTTIKITNAQLYDDDANYTCRISDGFGYKSKTYVVEVGYAPLIANADDETIYWDGQGKEFLACDAYMKPDDRDAEAKWFFNDVPSNVTNDDITTIRHPMVGYGKYTCEFSNIHGKASKNLLLVKGK